MSYRVVCKVSILNSQGRKSSARGVNYAAGLDVTETADREEGSEGEERERDSGSRFIKNTGTQGGGRQEGVVVRSFVNY